MKGHSLLELVISFMILLTVVLGIVSIFPLSSKATRQSMEITNLTFLAQMEIEELKRKEFSFFNTDAGLAKGAHPPRNFGAVFGDMDFSAYNYVTEVTDELVCSEDPTLVFLKKVKVTAYGPGDLNDPGTPKVTLSAYIRSYTQGTPDGKLLVMREAGVEDFQIGRNPKGRYYVVNVDLKKIWMKPEYKRMARYFPVMIKDKTLENNARIASCIPKI